MTEPSLTIDTLIPSSQSLTMTWSLTGADYANVLSGIISVYNNSTGRKTEIQLDALECSQDQYELKDLTNGTLYSIQIILAITEADNLISSDSKKATPSGKPAKPVIKSVVAVPSGSDKKISVVIQLGSDNGNSIDKVIMNVYNKQGDQQRTIHNVTPGLVTLTILSADVSNNDIYTVTASAVNEAGLGPSSDEKYLNLTTLPNAPTLLTASSLADSAIEITFDTNELDTVPNSEYQVFNYQVLNGTTSLLRTIMVTDPSLNITAGIAKYTLTSLVNGTIYDLSIKAKNIVNQSSSTASNKLSALPAAKPSFSTDGTFTVSINEDTPAKVDLVYEFGTIATTYHPVTYVAKFFKNGKGIAGTDVTGSAETSRVITARGLTAVGGDVFKVEVDLVATIPPEKLSTVGLPPGTTLSTPKAIYREAMWVLRPDAPTITFSEMIRLQTGNALTIFFKEPEITGGRAITTDQFRLVANGATIVSSPIPHTADYYVFAHGATANSQQNWSLNSPLTSYIASCRASNDGGATWSEWSAPVTKEYLAGRPMPKPLNFTATKEVSAYGDTFVDIKLTWEAPAAPAIATHYEIFRVEPDGSHIQIPPIYDGTARQYVDRVSTEPKTLTYQLRCFGNIDGQTNVSSEFVDANCLVSYAPKILFNNVSTDSLGNSVLNFSVKRNGSDLKHVLTIAVPDDSEETNDMIHEINDTLVINGRLNSNDGYYYFSQEFGYKMSDEMFIVVASNAEGTSYFDNIAGKSSDRIVAAAQPVAAKAAPAKAPAAPVAPAKAPAAPAKAPVKAPVKK